MKRRPTAHDIKRRLMRKLHSLPGHKAADIIFELRQYAIARKFYDGESVDDCTRDERFARHIDQPGVQAAIRRFSTIKQGGAR